MSSEYTNYLAALNYNQHAFIRDHTVAIHACEHIFANFTALCDIVKTGRDKNGKPHVSFLPFLRLMQRQSALAFDSLASCQSFTAWVHLRPCLEAALIMGKWVDDPYNATIWKDRQAHRRQYRETYEGQALRSRSLPSSDSIQTVLKLSNDDFMHMNYSYYERHLSLTSHRLGVQTTISFFDTEV